MGLYSEIPEDRPLGQEIATGPARHQVPGLGPAPGELRGMRPLLLLRHGETAWNAEARWQGWLDVELSAVGIDQAQRRARQLAAAGHGFVGVASSPLARARATAEIIASALDLGPVVTDAGLRERNGGEWQGRTRDEIEREWPNEFEALRHGRIDAPVGGEDTATLLARFDAALARLHAAMAPGLLLVVTHGGLARAATARAGHATATVLRNVGGIWVDYDPASARLLARDTLTALCDAHEISAADTVTD